MSVEWVRVSLRFWRDGGIAGQEPFKILNVMPESGLETVQGSTIDQASRIVFIDASKYEENSDSGKMKRNRMFHENVERGKN